MSILNYFKVPDPQADDDAGESQSGEMRSCSSSLPEVSDSEEDPSLPLRGKISRFAVTIH